MRDSILLHFANLFKSWCAEIKKKKDHVNKNTFSYQYWRDFIKKKAPQLITFRWDL